MTDRDLEHILGGIRLRHAQRFDPVRLAYITSLATRLQSPLFKSNVHLAEKLHTNAARFNADFNVRKESANKVLAEIATHFSQYQDEASDYFEQAAFKQLDQLRARLVNGSPPTDGLSLLEQLNRAMQRHVTDEKNTPKEPSLDDVLNQQEHELMGDSNALDPSFSDAEKPPLELQSMVAFRESMKYFNIDNVIDRAINDHPANPGPHNPHMLAIKSLTQMRELSPQYLRRFAGYIETLLWLEKNTAKLTDTKKVIK